MSKSIKLKNNHFWDSAGIVHNKKLLSDILSTKLYSGDLNDIKTSGFTWVNINATNRPTNGAFALTTIAVNNNYVFQEANESVNNPSLMATYQRHCYNGTWTAWRRIGDNYSTSEQIIGTWFGKPLYRKVITGTFPTITNGTAYSPGISIANNIDTVFVENGFVIRSDGVVAPIFYFTTNNGTYHLKCWISAYKNLNIYCDSGSFSNAQYYVSCCYTKTTD